MLLLALYFISFLAVDYISKHINGYSQKRYFQLIACFILLFVFFGFRGLPVLNDTAHYYAHLYNHLRYQSYFDESIFTTDPHERFEYGYLVWIHFITRYIWCDPYSIILISAFIVTIANLLLSITSKFNIFFSTIVAIIGSALHVDILYVANYVVPQLATQDVNTALIAILVQSIYGVTMFVAPTSIAVILGLSYLNIPYKEWIKKTWKLVLTLFAIVVVVLIAAMIIL